MHSRQASAFSAGSVDDDGFIVHHAKGFMKTASASVRPSARRSSGFRDASVRRSVLSQTSQAAAQRGMILPAGGIGASVFNLCSATLGAGVLALPKCGTYSGWLLTSIYVACSGFASAYAIVVLVMVSSRTGYMSYEEMALKILGSRKWVWLTVLLIALLCFGTAVGYIIAIGDVLDPFRSINGTPEWLQGKQGRFLSQVAWWMCFFLPASLPKHINALRLGSLAGVFSVTYLLIMMSVHLGQNEHKPEVEMIRTGSWNSLMSLPVIMFGYGCQVNTFEIYREMYRPSTKRMTVVASIALSLCSFFYIVAGILGYLDFGNAADDNILDNFNPTNSGMAAVAFVGISITVSMAFPLCVFPTRDALEFLIWPPTDSELEKDVDAGVSGAPESPNHSSRAVGGVLKSEHKESLLKAETLEAGADVPGTTQPQQRVAFNPVDSIREWNAETNRHNKSLNNSSNNATGVPDPRGEGSTGVQQPEFADRMPDEEEERAESGSSLLNSNSALGYGSVSSIIKKGSTGDLTAVASPNFPGVDALPEGSENGKDTEKPNEGMTDNKRRILVTIICILILGAGLFIPNITTAFGVIGGLCIGPIGYSIPAAFAIKSGQWTVESVGRVHIFGVHALFVYGVLCATLGTGISIYGIVNES